MSDLLSRSRLAGLFRRLPALSRFSPRKGLTDNPAWQWWRDPAILQPDSWWGAGRDRESLWREAELMRDLGVKLFRFEVPWRFIARERPGVHAYDAAAACDHSWPGYEWARLDLILEVLAAAGIEPVAVVANAPDWSTESTKRGALRSVRPEHFHDFVYALCSRYRSQVHFWELWNEPDHPHSWTGGLGDYVSDVLIPGAAAVRSIAPDCEIVHAGLADHRHIDRLLEPDAAQAWDIANFHLYPRSGSARRLRMAAREVAAMLRKHGLSGRPIWLTETGVATQPPSTPSDFGGVTDEAGQARFVRDVYRSVPVSAVFYYQLKDTCIVDSQGQILKRVHWGLASRDLSRQKPAAGSLRLVDRPRL